jgi:hypothetical protein
MDGIPQRLQIFSVLYWDGSSTTFVTLACSTHRAWAGTRNPTSRSGDRGELPDYSGETG